MIASSMGFHTFMIYMKITRMEFLELLEAFKRSSNMYFVDKSKGRNGLPVKINYSSKPYEIASRYYKTKYRREYQCRGLTWIIRESTTPSFYTTQNCNSYWWNSCDTESNEEEKNNSITVIINPKLLLEIDDYLTAADSSCLNQMIEVFNCEASKISPILKDFNSYSLKRNDYCVNFDLADLEINCIPEVYMALIKHADIPCHYEEYTRYEKDSKSHRKTSDANSYYLKSNSVHINCYYKYYQLSKMYPSTPFIDNSLYTIRFEIQCLFHKVWNMQKRIIDCDDFESKMKKMVSDETCKNVLTGYFQNTIGMGDYFTLDGARAKVKAMKFNRNKEDRLIGALEFVNQSRGIYKAKSHLDGSELAEFKRSINDLKEIGVNPVTIPREWNIKHLPNLMTAYLNQQEKNEQLFHEE